MGRRHNVGRHRRYGTVEPVEAYRSPPLWPKRRSRGCFSRRPRHGIGAGSHACRVMIGDIATPEDRVRGQAPARSRIRDAKDAPDRLDSPDHFLACLSTQFVSCVTSCSCSFMVFSAIRFISALSPDLISTFAISMAPLW